MNTVIYTEEYQSFGSIDEYSGDDLLKQEKGCAQLVLSFLKGATVLILLVVLL